MKPGFVRSMILLAFLKLKPCLLLMLMEWEMLKTEESDAFPLAITDLLK